MRTIFLLYFLTAIFPSHAGQIALSFDDAPTQDSPLMTGVSRTQQLIQQLEKHHVSQAIFFSTTQHLDTAATHRLRAYGRAGHLIGNHSHSHRSANNITTAEYLQDAGKAHELLKDLHGFTPLHRFPFLHYGASKVSIDALQEGLTELGYRNGYVTIDNADWYLNHRYLQAIQQGKPYPEKAFAQLYVDTLWQAIEFYDAWAKDILGKSPKHILLLHENDIAALFIGDLIEKIRREGWQIISAREAYDEPLLNALPVTTFHKQGRVAAIANAKGHTPEALRHPRENSETLDALLARLKTK